MKFDHAVICGGGFSGMLAALVCSRRFQKVTIVEKYPDSEAYGYAGTPQAHHVHIMSKKGQNIFDRLLPGTLERLKAEGAIEVDWAENTVWQGISGKAPHYRSGVRSLLFSRKLIEKYLYSQVKAIANIHYRQSLVKDFLFEGGEVKGVVLSDNEAIYDFNYCIDARGRTSNLKDRLAKEIGEIPENFIPNRLRYVTAIFDHKSETSPSAWLQYYAQANGKDTPLGYFASPIEKNRFVFTTVDYHGNIAKPFEMLDDHPMLKGQTITQRKVFTKLHNQHILYGKAKAWIKNLSVIGDAVCRLNPAYGHGLTLSLEHVELLESALQTSRMSTRRLQKDIECSVKEPWNFVKIDELRSPHASPNWYYRTLHRLIDFMGDAIVQDRKLHRISLEVLHRVRSPKDMMSPAYLLRVLKVHMEPYLARFSFAWQKIATLVMLLLISGVGLSAEVKDKTFVANGMTFHALESGESKAPLLLFLHGFPEYSGIWRSYLERFGNSYHAVAVDLRGYNKSDKPNEVEDYKLPKLVEDVRSFVSALGHQEAIVVAHDWGGVLAWHAISKHPDIFKRAVLINAPHPTVYAELFEKDPDQKKRSRYFSLLKLPFVSYFLEFNSFYMLRKNVFDESTRPLSEDQQVGYQNAWAQSLKHPINYYKANAPSDVEFRTLPVIQVPTLLIWGENDKWLSLKNLENLDPWVKDLTIKRFPDATHWVQHEKFEELATDIQYFLNSQSE